MNLVDSLGYVLGADTGPDRHHAWSIGPTRVLDLRILATLSLVGAPVVAFQPTPRTPSPKDSPNGMGNQSLPRAPSL
jgi:hypothetical protein